LTTTASTGGDSVALVPRGDTMGDIMPPSPSCDIGISAYCPLGLTLPMVPSGDVSTRSGIDLRLSSLPLLAAIMSPPVGGGVGVPSLTIADIIASSPLPPLIDVDVMPDVDFRRRTPTKTPTSTMMPMPAMMPNTIHTHDGVPAP